MAGDGECNNITIDNEVAAAIKYLKAPEHRNILQ